MLDAILKGLSGMGDYMTKNPNQTAIMLDMMGRNVDPNNMFAGVGTAMGQSNLAADAQAQQQRDRQVLLPAILKAMGIDVPEANPGGGASSAGLANASPTAQATGAPGLSQLPNLTPADQPGPTQMTTKLDNNGNLVQSTLSTLAGPEKKKGVNLSDYLPLIEALSGGQPANLRGLTPEQIAAVSRNDLGLGDLQRATLESLFNMKHREAQAAAELAKVDSFNAENYAQARSHEAAAHLRNVEALIKQREELRNTEMHPLLLKDKMAEIDGRIANAVQSYAAANASNASAGHSRAQTGKVQLETRLAQELDTIVKGLPEGTTFDALPLGAQLKILGGDASSWLNNSADAQLRQQKVAGEALARIDNGEATAADVSEWNLNAPAKATFGVIWTGFVERPWFLPDAKAKAVRVTLPNGWTMGQVRMEAAQAGLTEQQLLERIYEKYGAEGQKGQ